MAPLTMKRVSAIEAKVLLDTGWTYLDVRSEQEFEVSHPAGAWNVPLLVASPQGLVPNAEFERVARAVLQPHARIVVGCQSGTRSLRAAQVLEEAGWREVVDLRPGFGGARDALGRIVEPGWATSGLPVERGKPEGLSYAALVARANAAPCSTPRMQAVHPRLPDADNK